MSHAGILSSFLNLLNSTSVGNLFHINILQEIFNRIHLTKYYNSEAD